MVEFKVRHRDLRTFILVRYKSLHHHQQNKQTSFLEKKNVIDFSCPQKRKKKKKHSICISMWIFLVRWNNAWIKLPFSTWNIFVSSWPSWPPCSQICGWITSHLFNIFLPFHSDDLFLNLTLILNFSFFLPKYDFLTYLIFCVMVKQSKNIVSRCYEVGKRTNEIKALFFTLEKWQRHETYIFNNNEKKFDQNTKKVAN